MSKTITVEVDLDHPAIQAAITREAELAASQAEDAGADAWDEFRDEVTCVRDSLETIRRHLCAPKPSPAEAMLYVERALEAIARMK